MVESRLQNRWQGLARLFSFTRPPHANKFGATLHLAQIFLATKSLRWDQLVQGFSADARLAGRLVDQQLGVGLQRCNVPHIGNLDALEQSIFVIGRHNLHVGHGCIGNRSHVPEWHSDASALAQVELHATHCGHQNCPITSLAGINPVSEGKRAVSFVKVSICF